MVILAATYHADPTVQAGIAGHTLIDVLLTVCACPAFCAGTHVCAIIGIIITSSTILTQSGPITWLFIYIEGKDYVQVLYIKNSTQYTTR